MIARLDALNSKVGDILRFARPRTPACETFDVMGVLLDAMASARDGSGCPQFVGPEQSVMVRADREMLRAVFLNLLLNACQSGTQAPVEIGVSVEDARCRVTIADRGTGIAPEVSAHLFEPFFTTKKSGTGLGLAIVQRLLSLQNGTVTLRPRDGGGALAEVSIPIPSASSAAAE